MGGSHCTVPAIPPANAKRLPLNFKKHTQCKKKHSDVCTSTAHCQTRRYLINRFSSWCKPLFHLFVEAVVHCVLRYFSQCGNGEAVHKTTDPLSSSDVQKACNRATVTSRIVCLSHLQHEKYCQAQLENTKKLWNIRQTWQRILILSTGVRTKPEAMPVTMPAATDSPVLSAVL